MLPILLTMLVFAVLHSLLAGKNIKQAFRQRFGERAYYGLYRLLYNVLATLSLIPVGLALVLQPGTILWRVEGVGALVLLGIQAVGVIALFISLMQIDFGQFTGLSQLGAYLSGAPLPLPAEPLQTRGLYGLVRHPLYLFSLLVIWPSPIMTESLLAFNIATTLYFVVGSRLEEKRLVAIFGDTYLEYRRRVPWLIPIKRTLS